jgi:orotate phosphoribosyltransferase
MTTVIRSALLNLIATTSFKLGDFTLASGQKSDYYVDCRTTTLHAEGGRLAGLVLYDLIREHIPSAVAVGGLTMGADPLVSNVASASAWALADYNEIRRLSSELELDEGDSEPAPTLIHGFLVARRRRRTARAAASKASCSPARRLSSSTTYAPRAALPSPQSRRRARLE